MVAFGTGVTLAPAQAQQSFTLGYSTGFLQDPFQVIQSFPYYLGANMLDRPLQTCAAIARLQAGRS